MSLLKPSPGSADISSYRDQHFKEWYNDQACLRFVALLIFLFCLVVGRDGSASRQSRRLNEQLEDHILISEGFYLPKTNKPPVSRILSSPIQQGSRTEQEKLLRQSTTLYIGNLSFYTTEEQIHELFSRCGDVKRIVMGLDKAKKTPCGFCFVEYYVRSDSESAMRYINGTRLDDRIIRTDWDAGFKEGRQYGRGKTGGQVRDEYRTDFDEGRGGYGKIVATKIRSRDSL